VAHRSDEKGHDARHELIQICSFVRQINLDRIGRWRETSFGSLAQPANGGFGGLIRVGDRLQLAALPVSGRSQISVSDRPTSSGGIPMTAISRASLE
jgi:hypothetical protein